MADTRDLKSLGVISVPVQVRYSAPAHKALHEFISNRGRYSVEGERETIGNTERRRGIVYLVAVISAFCLGAVLGTIIMGLLFVDKDDRGQ